MRTELLEVFAITACYLVLTLPLSGAVQFQLYNPSGIPQTSVYFYPESLISRQVSVDTGTQEVVFRVTNATPSVAVTGVWLYTCGDNSPTECIAGTQISSHAYQGEADARHSWPVISSGNPERTGLLYFVRYEQSGRASWSAFWTLVTKNSQTSFSIEEEEPAQVGVFLADPGMDYLVSEFIRNYGMAPVNPDWVSSIIFSGTSSVHEISASGPSDLQSPGRPQASEVPGDEVSGFPLELNFLFPEDTDVLNPVTAFDNPVYTCGMFGCEPGKGETSQNCCLDCGCVTGYYCDGSQGCKPESGIGLSLYGSVDPRVSNCYETHVVTIPVQVTSPPSSYTVSETWCKLGGSFGPCSCARSGDIFTCDVEVPPFENCGSGEFRVSDNAVRLKLDYTDGSTQASRYAETSFPDVTVGSFTCGSQGCESDLGEYAGNCCYDCPCPEGQYCNHLWGADPSGASCFQEPGPSSLRTESVSPQHFYDHTPPDRSILQIVMDSAPHSLEVQGISCDLACIYDSAEPCSAACTAEWSVSSSSDPLKKNLSVALDFSVSDYSALREYVLSPTLTFDVRYRDGPRDFLTSQVTKTFSQLSIGAHWCGDGNCGQDESFSTCCFDCECPAGQYCDTQSLSGPTQGDSCQTEDFMLVVDEIWDLDLNDSAISHSVPVLLHVDSPPSGASVSADCRLAGGEIPCSVTCSELDSSEEEVLNWSCSIRVPSIDYVNSPFYNSGSREIRFGQNSLNLTLAFNDGGEKRSREYLRDLGQAVVNVTSHCGEGSDDPGTAEFDIQLCETWLGEDQSSCCRDCGCGGFGDEYFCYQGASLNGECVDSETMVLVIEGFEPDPLECLIGRFGGNCTFVKSHVVNSMVLNAAPDLDIIRSGFSMDGSRLEDLSCLETATYGGYDCGFAPRDIRVQWEGGSSDEPPGMVSETSQVGSFELKFGVRYNISNMTVTDNLTDTREFTTSLVKSDALISCEDEINYIRDQISDLEENQALNNVLGVLYMVMGALYIYIGYELLSTPPPVSAATIAMGLALILMGGLQLVLGIMGMTQSDGTDVQIDQLEATLQQKIELCSSTDFEDMAEATQGMQSISPFNY